MITLNGTVVSFFLACLVYWLFKKGIDIIITNQTVNKLFKIILFIISLIIAFSAQIFIHA